MKFVETRLHGAVLVEPSIFPDDRGFFARTFSGHEFEAHGLHLRVAESAIASNLRRGTLRGMHYQVAPHDQVKLVRCSRGAMFDVIVDLRSPSPTFRSWLGVELSAEHGNMVYIPAGFAHGYLTLADDTEVHYHLSSPQHDVSARGFRWDDPSIGIEWPFAPEVMNGRDRAYPDLGAGPFEQ